MKAEKTKSGSTPALFLALVFAAGLSFSAFAAGRAPVWHKKETSSNSMSDSDAAASPVPVVDDTPIDPDTAGKKAFIDAQRKRDRSGGDGQNARKKVKPRRLW